MRDRDGINTSEEMRDKNDALSLLDLLEQLSEFKKSGVITETEYAEKKEGILATVSKKIHFQDEREWVQQKSVTANATTVKPTITKVYSVNTEHKKTFVYAILLAIFGVVMAWSSFVDGYFHWSYDNSNLSSGRRDYESSFLTLIGEVPIGDLIVIVFLAAVLTGVLLAWLSAVKDKRLEIYCVIAAVVVVGVVLISGSIAPIFFTEHENFGFGFYSYRDFEKFGAVFYVQAASAGGFLATSIVSRIKSVL